jgi:hypothetical protein
MGLTIKALTTPTGNERNVRKEVRPKGPRSTLAVHPGGLLKYDPELTPDVGTIDLGEIPRYL